MELLRTANAGIYVKTGGVSFLVDGVCEDYPPYLGTPPALMQALSEPYPDVVAFTHRHPDHYSSSYADSYERKTLRSVIGPESFPRMGGSLQLGSVRLTALPSRHIGKAADIPHMSYVIEGDKRIFILGDAAPLQWRGKNLPKVDVVVVPYAYAITAPAWAFTKALGAEKIVLYHMPDRDNDPHGLWQQVDQTVGEEQALVIPQIGQWVRL